MKVKECKIKVTKHEGEWEVTLFENGNFLKSSLQELKKFLSMPQACSILCHFARGFVTNLDLGDAIVECMYMEVE